MRLPPELLLLLLLLLAGGLAGAQEFRGFDIDILPFDEENEAHGEYDPELDLEAIGERISSIGFVVEKTELVADPAALQTVGVDVRSASKLLASAAGNIEVSTGQMLYAEASDAQFVVGGTTKMDSGDIEIGAQQIDMAARGSIKAVTASESALSAGSVSVQVASDVATTAGGDVELLSGGRLSVQSSGAAAAMFGQELGVAAAAIDVAAGGKMNALAEEVTVQGTEGVRVVGAGSSVEMFRSKLSEWRQFHWRSPASFDSHQNLVQPIAGGSESGSIKNVVAIVIRPRNEGQALVDAEGPLKVSLLIATRTATGLVEWTQAWTQRYTSGVYSLDGLAVDLPEPVEFVGVRLVSDPTSGRGGNFVGWADVTFELGLVGLGSMSLQSEGDLQATVGGQMKLSSKSIGFAANGAIDIAAVDHVGLLANSLGMRTSESLRAEAGENMELAAARRLELTAGEDGISAATGGRAELVAGAGGSVIATGGLNATADAATIEVTGQLSATSAGARIAADGVLEARAGQLASLMAGEVAISTTGALSAFANGRASLLAADAMLQTTGSVTAHASSANVALDGPGQLITEDTLDLQAGDLRANSGTVRIRATSGPPATRKARASLTLDADSFDLSTPGAKRQFEQGFLQELSAELGVPVDRLKLKGF